MDDDVKPLSHLGKGSKHSSMLLSTGDLPKLRNSHDLDSAAVSNSISMSTTMASKQLIISNLSMVATSDG